MRALDPRLLGRHEVGAAAAGRSTARSGSGPPSPCCSERRCSRGSPRRAFHGAPLRDLGPDFALLVIAFAVRGAFAWAMEVAGRRAAWSTLSELRLALVERRLRAHPIGGRRRRRRRDHGRRGAGSRGARGLLRALPAAGRARLHRPVPRDRAGSPSVDLEAAVIMLLTLPLVPVFMWLIGTLHGGPDPGAVAGVASALEPLPRRRARPADAARVRPGSRRGGDRRRGQRALPQGDDGDAPDQLPVRAPCSSWRRRSGWPSSR